MISDDPDEDADSFDDAAMESIAADPAPRQENRGDAGPRLPDWPSTAAREAGLTVDPWTAAWFQSRYWEWRQQAAAVLRAWTGAEPIEPMAIQALQQSAHPPAAGGPQA